MVEQVYDGDYSKTKEIPITIVIINFNVMEIFSYSSVKILQQFWQNLPN